MVKLHGLYDNDHRRIRHSTLDELPSLVSASVLGTLVARRPAGAEPGRPALARRARSRSASARWSAASSCAASCASLWHRADRAGDRASWSGRPPPSTWSRAASSTHPETRLRLVGYLSAAATRPRPSCRGSARSPTSPRVAREHEIERVVVTEQEMSEPAAERLIEECKAAGPGADLPAPALRPAGTGDRAEPAGRAAGPRLPLLRPARARRRR